MIELMILKKDSEILETDKGYFHVMEDYVISERTGEVYSVAGSTTDGDGNLVQLMIE